MVTKKEKRMRSIQIKDNKLADLTQSVEFMTKQI